MNKHGAFQMAIETIVLIVLALVLAGLAIALTTGILDKGKDQLLNSLSLTDLQVKATSDDVLTGTDVLRLQRNHQELIAASFYNKNTPECADGATFQFYCPQLTYTFDTTPIGVPIGEQRTIGGVIKVDKIVPKIEYVCVVEVFCSGIRPVSELTYIQVR